MKTKLLSMMLATAALFALSASANAEPITVPNAGFEIRTDVADGAHVYTRGASDFWRHFDVTDNGGPVRLWNPGVLGTGSPGFGGDAPEGKMIVRVYTRYNDDRPSGAPHVRDFEAAAQILTQTFDPTVPYTLTAKVGHPDGLLWNGYAVQLVAGGTNTGGAQYALGVVGGTVVAEDYNTKTVPEGKFVTSTVVYTPNPEHASLAGLPLQIRLCALEDPANHATTSYAAFDDVKLDYGPLNAGDDMITWSGEPVQLAPTTGGYTPSTYAWSADPADGVVFSATDVEAPTVTITTPPRPVSIVNPGFEIPVLADGTATSTPSAWTDGYYAVAAPTVWVVGDSNAGAYNPAFGTDYGGVAPEGDNLMYATSGVGYDKGMNQVLSATLQANTQYDLSALVGNPFLFNGSTAAGNYRIELLAGGVLLASDTGPSPADDTTWKTGSLTYNSGASPAQLGGALEIRLLAVDFTNGKGVDFDDVKLTADGPSPDPYTVTLKLVVDGSVHEDTMTIDVYDTACLAARIGGRQAADNPADFSANCITNFEDLAEMVGAWLTSTASTGPVPK